jgi:MFS family permease
LADGSFKVALPLVAVATTNSPALIAGVTLAATLPWLLVALPAGAVADRGDRRRIMVGANVARGALLAVFGVLCALRVESIVVLYLVAFAAGIAEVFYATSAQAIVPMVVDRPFLRRANAAQQISDQAANQFAGPALGGLLIGIGGTVSSFTSGGLWLLAVAGLFLVRGTFRTVRPAARKSLRGDVVAGVRFLLGSRVLRSITLRVGVTNFAGSAATAVFVIYAVGRGSALGLSPAGYGILLTASAAGSILGVFLVAPLRKVIGERGLMTGNIITQAIQIGLPAVVPHTTLVGAAFFIGGIGVALWNVSTVTLRQRLTPPALLGRVVSAYRLVSWGAMPLGALAGGLLAGLMPLQAVFALMTAVTLSALVGTNGWSGAQISREESA